MIVSIRKSKPKGTVTAPPSKSFAHRELIAGMLSGGSTIHGLSYNEDVSATLGCITSFGAHWTGNEDRINFDGWKANDGSPTFDCRESGSTLRFFLLIALTKYSSFTLKGSSRLMERGVGAYEACLSKHGISFAKTKNEIKVSGELKSGIFEIDASTSSQYVSGLLFALPLLSGDSEIVYLGESSSKAYIDMTCETLALFGIKVTPTGHGFLIPGHQVYQPREIRVEGDYSNAAFLDAFAALGCDVKVEGLNPDSSQGDKVYQKHFSSLKEGCASIDVDSCIDLAPVLFAFAALNHGGTFTGISRLAIKESNRALATKEELGKTGCQIELSENKAEVHPIQDFPSHVSFASHNDHRIAMALSLLALFTDVDIDGAECVKKSFPNYFDTLSSLGMEVSQHE